MEEKKDLGVCFFFIVDFLKEKKNLKSRVFHPHLATILPTFLSTQL